MTKYLPLIAGMMLVTYLPRLLPLVALSKRPLPRPLRRFLANIPYAALGALIVRGVAESAGGMLPATLAGITVAAVFSYFGGGLVSSVVAAIAAAYLTLSL
ncbi:MAG TPA: AzlD domain-containing protein [Negativicutes bacterium]|nr:AzlD domain-containing protein [Negativicutes bacterium]